MKALKKLVDYRVDSYVLSDPTPSAKKVLKHRGPRLLRALDKEAIKEALDIMAENKELDKIEEWVNFAFRDETEDKEFFTYEDQVDDFYDFEAEYKYEDDLDMAGNLWEWTLDDYDETIYASCAADAPTQ